MGRGPSINWGEKGPQVEKLIQSLNCTDIAKITGINSTAIRAYCFRNGLGIKRKNLHQIKLSEHDKELMVLLRIAGMPLSEVAEKFDVKYRTASIKTAKVYRLLKLRVDGFSLGQISKKTGVSISQVKKLTDNLYSQL